MIDSYNKTMDDLLMRFHLIDALRGFAALWVVLYHANEGGHLDGLVQLIPEAFVMIIFELGHAGVPIFFVLSGFVIAHSIKNDSVNGSYFAKFTLRRSLRLDPPYWAAIVLVILLAWLSSNVKGEFYELPDLVTILAHMFYLQGILEIPHLSIIFWTLCLEIQFYLVFCGLAYLTQKFEKYTNKAFVIIFTLVGLISLLWPVGMLKENIYPGLFLPFFHAFLLGVFTYWSWQKKISIHFFYLYFLIVIISSVISQSSFSIAAALTAFIIHECARFNLITSLNWRWIQFLGVISYSLYLTHSPITGASYFLFYRLFGDSIFSQAIAFLVSTGTCIIFAYMFWWLFEKWSIKLSKKVLWHKGKGPSNKEKIATAVSCKKSVN